MNRRTQENIAAAAFLAVFIGVIVLSLGFGPRARMIPLPLAIFGAVLALIQLVWQNLGSTDALKMDLISVMDPLAGKAELVAMADEPGKPERAPADRASWRKQSGAYGIVAGLLALTLLLGPLPAVFVFTLGYFVATRYCAPLVAVLHATLFTLAIYLLFFVALQVQPYHGVLAPLMARFE